MAATARISVNVEEEVKQKAQQVLGEIGMDLTTGIDIFLRTIGREGRIPFDLRTEKAYKEAVHREYIRAELEKSILEAADPNTKRFTHEEIMAGIEQRREARKHA